MWFSYDTDLTNSLAVKQARLAAEEGGRGGNDAGSMREPLLHLPLWRRVDKRFWWNESMMKEFIELGVSLTSVIKSVGVKGARKADVSFSLYVRSSTPLSVPLCKAGSRSRPSTSTNSLLLPTPDPKPLPPTSLFLKLRPILSRRCRSSSSLSLVVRVIAQVFASNDEGSTTKGTLRILLSQSRLCGVRRRGERSRLCRSEAPVSLYN
jgi:hypothetical protein